MSALQVTTALVEPPRRRLRSALWELIESTLRVSLSTIATRAPKTVLRIAKVPESAFSAVVAQPRAKIVQLVTVSVLTALGKSRPIHASASKASTIP